MSTIILVALLVFIYSSGLVLLWFSWRKIPLYEITSSTSPSVSVVVAFRNEALRLPSLLKALMEQEYPSEQVEIILVNDHSEDNFKPLLSVFSKANIKWQLISLSDGLTGKKQALSQGIAKAHGEWILTTDADCVFGKYWIKTMLNHVHQSGARFVFGPVAYARQGDFLLDFQAIELSSLIGSGAALWQCGYPTMCNGANLLYKRALVAREDVYSKNAHLASGDDEFLMHEVFKAHEKEVSFVKDRAALVETEACSSWADFYQQRKRWASKWGAYQLVHVKMIALAVFILNAAYALMPFLLLWNSSLMLWILIAYCLRWILDGIFLNEISKFYEKPFNLVSYVGVALIYPYYVVVSALAGRFGKYTWKGRTVS